MRSFLEINRYKLKMQKVPRCNGKVQGLRDKCLVHCDEQLRGSLKFHLLDHGGQDIATFGTMLNVSASIFEKSNILFKQMYSATSTRRKTAMDETVRCYSAAIEDKASTKYKYKLVSLLIGLPQFPNACTTFPWEELSRDPAALMTIGTLQPD